MVEKFHLSPKSSNRKTGPIPVTTSGTATCPTTCPFKAGGCYANGGPLRLHWSLVSSGERGDTWEQFLARISELPAGQIWRHNQAGDLVGTNDKLDMLKAMQLCEANTGKAGFTYTHYPVEGRGHVARFNQSIIRKMNEAGFTVNLSANDPAHADELAELSIGPVTTMMPSDMDVPKFKTPGGRTVIMCPAAREDDKLTWHSPTCDQCALCAKPNRKAIIGFPAHGSQKGKVDAYIMKDMP